MAVVFLSDVHLSENEPAITAAFLDYLETLRADPPEALFILGDLFHVWLGDHIADQFSGRIATQLKALGALCPLFFQHGNRDFLIGTRFARESGMTLLPERYQFTLDGQRIVLEHGDLLCSDDLGYQRLRRILRHPWFIRLAQKTPYWLNTRIGAFLRRGHKKYSSRTVTDWADVNSETLQQVMNVWPCDLVIHGHTHRPGEHVLADGRRRFVLGDWRPQGEVLICDTGRFQLMLPMPAGSAAPGRDA